MEHMALHLNLGLVTSWSLCSSKSFSRDAKQYKRLGPIVWFLSIAISNCLSWAVFYFYFFYFLSSLFCKPLTV